MVVVLARLVLEVVVGATVVVVSATVVVVGRIVVVVEIALIVVEGAEDGTLELATIVVATESLMHPTTSIESTRHERTLLMSSSVSPPYRFGGSLRRRDVGVGDRGDPRLRSRRRHQPYPDHRRGPHAGLGLGKANAVSFLRAAATKPGTKAVIIDAETIPAIDVTAVRMLIDVTDELRADGVDLVLAHDIGQVRDLLPSDERGTGPALYRTIDEAIAAVRSKPT